MLQSLSGWTKKVRDVRKRKTTASLTVSGWGLRKSPENLQKYFFSSEFCKQDGGMSLTLGFLVRSNDDSLSECDSTSGDHWHLQRADVSFGSYLPVYHHHVIPFRELELEKTSSRTGCLKPCTYIEYSLKAVQKISTKNSSSLFLRMAESKISFKKELWVYDEISLVSEIGGALGLFVGFSFLSLADLVTFIYDVYKKN